MYEGKKWREDLESDVALDEDIQHIRLKQIDHIIQKIFLQFFTIFSIDTVTVKTQKLSEEYFLN